MEGIEYMMGGVLMKECAQNVPPLMKETVREGREEERCDIYTSIERG